MRHPKRRGRVNGGLHDRRETGRFLRFSGADFGSGEAHLDSPAGDFVWPSEPVTRSINHRIVDRRKS